MNKFFSLSLLAGAIFSAISMSAFADESGKVTFSGRIIADTCEINVNGSGSENGTVTFADTYPDDYGNDGAIGTSKDFTIELMKCDPIAANLNLKFTGVTTDSEHKRLQNELVGASDATNVGITLQNKNGGDSSVLFDGSEPESATNVANDPAGLVASVFNYTANVIQVGDTAPTAGQYSASTTFEVLYR